MSKTKDYLIGLQEAEFNKEPMKFRHNVGHSTDPSGEEVFEVRRGEYVSEIRCRFNDKGYLISTQTNSKPTTGDIEHQIQMLEGFIFEAVKIKDFTSAETMQRQIDELKNQHKGE